MEPTHRPSATTRVRRPNRLVELLLGQRHSLPLSIALHLVPGALIVAAYLFIAEPFVTAIGYPTFMAWAIALVLVLYPIQLGLLWLGRKKSGRFTLRGVLHYRDRPLSRGKLLALGLPLFGWMFVLGFALIPLDGIVFETFFTWVPFADVGGSPTTYLDGFERSVVLTTLLICAPLTGVTLPLIEEYYFRGFLMPRIAHLGAWAPVLSTVLFSVYHFWSPWGIVSRLVFFFPGPWLVWKKRDLRLSIMMHVGTTSVLSVAGTIALALGVI